MKALIVYDSVFGNTKEIALAIGNALGKEENVRVLPVGDAKGEDLARLELLIVGSPTRAFNPTKAIMNFLNGISSEGVKGVKVAAFDTRISTADANSRLLNLLVKMFGYAAKPIADRLKKKGGELIIPPEGFLVKDSEGPLKDGEPQRAADWAKSMVEAINAVREPASLS